MTNAEWFLLVAAMCAYVSLLWCLDLAVCVLLRKRKAWRRRFYDDWK